MKWLPVVLLVLLTGCDVEAAHRAIACRHAAGPEPFPAAELFGLGGMLTANANPEQHAWNERITACMHDRTALNE